MVLFKLIMLLKSDTLFKINMTLENLKMYLFNDPIPLVLKHIFHFPSAFSELLELSSLVSRHTIYAQQSVEEEQLGLERTQELLCHKH